MKKIILATILSGAIAAPAMAASNTGLTDASLIFNVQDQQALQLEVLSSKEMKETEGAFGPWGALGGGLIGGIGNIGYQLGSNQDWNWGSLGYSVGGGALTGFTGGAASWYVVPRVAFAGGFGAGYFNW